MFFLLEPTIFSLEDNENFQVLMNDLNILSKSNDIEHAEETYKDQLVNITTHIKQFSRTKTQDFPNDYEKSDKTTIISQKSDLDFDRIEVIERMPNPNSLIFQENKEACQNLLKIIRFRKKYLFSEHQPCIFFSNFNVFQTQNPFIKIKILRN